MQVSMQSSTAATADMQQQLAQACHSLWLATLSLMTAYMHNGAPMHRYMLARKIARNFTTLKDQECFGAHTRDYFAKLARRWQRTADSLSPDASAPQGVFTWLQRLFAR